MSLSVGLFAKRPVSRVVFAPHKAVQRRVHRPLVVPNLHAVVRLKVKKDVFAHLLKKDKKANVPNLVVKRAKPKVRLARRRKPLLQDAKLDRRQLVRLPLRQPDGPRLEKVLQDAVR